MPKKTGTAEGPVSDCATTVEKTPTLGEMGIDYNLSSRAQKLAQVPDDEFEETLAERRDDIKAADAKAINKLEKAAARKNKAKPDRPRAGEDVETENAALRSENAELRERVAELGEHLNDMMEEVARLQRIVDAGEHGDTVKQCLTEVKMLEARIRELKTRIDGLMAENVVAIQQAKPFMRRVEALERQQRPALPTRYARQRRQHLDS